MPLIGKETVWEITNTEWEKVQNIIDQKNKLIDKQVEVIVELQKYKAKDDLLYNYEQENEMLRKQLQEAQSQNTITNKELAKQKSIVKTLTDKLQETFNQLEIHGLVNRKSRVKALDLKV